jgi:hypothetical protein
MTKGQLESKAICLLRRDNNAANVDKHSGPTDQQLSSTAMSSEVIRKIEGPGGSFCLRQHPRLGLFQTLEITDTGANVVQYHRRWDSLEEAQRYADRVEAVGSQQSRQPRR